MACILSMEQFIKQMALKMFILELLLKNVDELMNEFINFMKQK